jgi:hypothetical protein
MLLARRVSALTPKLNLHPPLAETSKPALFAKNAKDAAPTCTSASYKGSCVNDILARAP